MTAAKRRLIGICLGLGITLFIAGVNMLVSVSAQDVTPEATPEAIAIYDLPSQPIEPTGDNGYCLVCHSRPWKTVTLQDGTIMNLYVNPNTMAASVHGVNSSTGSLGCLDCHGADSFPHNGPTPNDERTYRLDSVAICASCHTEEIVELESGLHEEAILAGNTEAAVCTDCHGAHDVQPVVEESELIAGVCGDCHTSTLTEWRASAHVDIGPLGCATCHSPHSQRIRAGDTAAGLCLNCHNEMPDLWVHQQHASNDFPVACTDCHMYTPEHAQTVNVNLSETFTAHTMELTSLPCNTCHEQLMVDGTWATLSGDSETLRTELETLRQELATLQETKAEQPTSEPITFTPLLQGLILGVGLGATFATIFVVRGAQTSSPAPETPKALDTHGVSDHPESNPQPEVSQPTENSNSPDTDNTSDKEESS
ncbi:MAG: cytochrome c3 family protein [Anaerolineae bacterium]|nr:cytochrome c3 family protein [Anaerolineae bacterium]